ncbi:MAG: glycosyltransferase family 2 protein [Gallionellaceae bacterium]|nr:glycosyltransferase family 2 protein [Gallionellaceae bacterium]
MSFESLSIILPAKNEAAGLELLLVRLHQEMPRAEIIVVDDGSTDETQDICERLGTKRIAHPYSMGNGAAVKSGARSASGEILVFMDADGQHDPTDIARLLERLDQGYDMAVGARPHNNHAGKHRALANSFFNRLASWMVKHRIEDLTSGFRAVRADKFRRFLHLLPNGFSYPTTITMSFFRAGFPVAYVPIQARKREGKSHIRLLRDGTRFLLIIVRIGTLYSPFRLFLPVSLTFFLMGLGYYAYTFITQDRFTNMSALMFSSAILTFLIGIVSEQITALHYKDTEH